MVMLAGCMAVGACAHEDRTNLSGVWVGTRAGNFELSELARATAWVKGLRLRFGRDQLVVERAGEPTRSRSYRVERRERGRLTLQVGDDASHEQLTLVLDGRDQIRWEMDEGRYVVLQRLR